SYCLDFDRSLNVLCACAFFRVKIQILAAAPKTQKLFINNLDNGLYETAMQLQSKISKTETNKLNLEKQEFTHLFLVYQKREVLCLDCAIFARFRREN